jgi:uncharacterized membrane protein YoaK (UPF0700 family)
MLRALLITMTVVTGIVDAVSYLGLNHVFVANMTGNVVFLGFALSGAPGLSLVASITAVLAFLLGALAGGRLGARAAGDRVRLLKAAAVVQTGLVILATVFSLFVDDAHVGTVHSEVLIVLLGAAMGVQNAAARKIALPDLTTTVLTLTLTGFAADSKAAGGAGGHPLRKLTAVAAMLGGALAGGLLLKVDMWVALLAAVVLLVGITAVAFRFSVPEDAPGAQVT